MASKVVLVNPGRQENRWASIHPPIHLGGIASYLEQNGVEVRIVDELAGQDVAESLSRLKPDIVGITATTPMAPDAYRAAKAARDMGMLTVMGGKHAMILPEEALKHVDIVVIGEGEKAMLDVAMGLRQPIIQGTYTKNLDELPPPAWHLMDMDFYLAPRDHSSNHMRFFPRNSRIGMLLTTRGCPYRCAFCYNSWRDTPVRLHSAERIFFDIRTLIERYETDSLFFMDDDLFFDRKRFRELARLIIGSNTGIRWGCQASVNSVDRETLEIAKRSGCIHVGMGFESGSPRILEILKKGRTTVEKNRRAALLCREAGVNSFATFMVGNPTETVDDVRMTMKFIRETPLDGIGVLVTTPFPGTDLWKWCEERNLIPENLDWSLFTTGRVSIPACDTLSGDEIMLLRDLVHYTFYPACLTDMLRKPALLADALKHPFRMMRILREIFRRFMAGLSPAGGSTAAKESKK